MSRDFIDAIENGDNIEAESEFSNVMMSKVGNELEAHRQELANEFVNEKLVTELTPAQKQMKTDYQKKMGGREHGGAPSRVRQGRPKPGDQRTAALRRDSRGYKKDKITGKPIAR